MKYKKIDFDPYFEHPDTIEDGWYHYTLEPEYSDEGTLTGRTLVFTLNDKRFMFQVEEDGMFDRWESIYVICAYDSINNDIRWTSTLKNEQMQLIGRQDFKRLIRIASTKLGQLL